VRRGRPASILRLATLFGLDGWRHWWSWQKRGLDLDLDAVAADTRLDAIYAHARRALYATIADGGDPRGQPAPRARQDDSGDSGGLSRASHAGECLRDDDVRDSRRRGERGIRRCRSWYRMVSMRRRSMSSSVP
jgi:hypothetical protein